uniref:Uncharacterized protein n=1 Tax=Oryza barthii TaxID=65489 RepID=A0A0D3H1F9_9ORYZ
MMRVLIFYPSQLIYSRGDFFFEQRGVTKSIAIRKCRMFPLKSMFLWFFCLSEDSEKGGRVLLGSPKEMSPRILEFFLIYSTVCRHDIYVSTCGYYFCLSAHYYTNRLEIIGYWLQHKLFPHVVLTTISMFTYRISYLLCAINHIFRARSVVRVSF